MNIFSILKSLTRTSFFIVLISSLITVIIIIILIVYQPRFAVKLIEFLSPSPSPIPIELKGIAVIGDSQSDEYRTDDKRGYTYAPTTLNWVEILGRYRNLYFGKIGQFEEPRRSGYQYNYARTGATTLSMLSSGQHIGVSKLVKDNNVNVIIIYIGANDFAPSVLNNGYEAIYDDNLTDAQLFEKINSTVSNIKTAVDTIQSSGDVRIILVTIPDWGRNPSIRLAFPLPHQRTRVTDVINQVNNELKILAKKNNLLLIDINKVYENLQSQRLDKKIAVGDLVLENTLPSDNPRHLFLDDGIHAGTVLNALFANEIIQTLNTVISSPISTLSHDEILQISGL